MIMGVFVIRQAIFVGRLFGEGELLWRWTIMSVTDNQVIITTLRKFSKIVNISHKASIWNDPKAHVCLYSYFRYCLYENWILLPTQKLSNEVNCSHRFELNIFLKLYRTFWELFQRTVTSLMTWISQRSTEAYLPSLLWIPLLQYLKVFCHHRQDVGCNIHSADFIPNK